MALERQFSDESACQTYLFDLRWPDGFICSQCGGNQGVGIRRSLFRCMDYRRETSVTAGTLFQNSKMPLALWFRVMRLVTSQKNGISALGLQRTLGLGIYKTAWSMLHKFRLAMVCPGRERLSGFVEVDETYWGGEEAGVRGRQIVQKALVVIATEADGRGIGRIRMPHIPDVSRDTLHGFIAQAIEPVPCKPMDYRRTETLTGISMTAAYKASNLLMANTCCRACIELLRCLSAGFWEPVKERSARSTWMTI